MKLDAAIDELLNDPTYHIEFNGHLTNHAKHAVVALVGLGASSQKVHSYYHHYAKLTPYGYGLEPPKPSRYLISDANWAEHLGKRTSYSSYVQFFERKERELGQDALLKHFLPRLLPGWVGSLTHGAIHLGWALDIGNRSMLIEGLAYMAFSYVSCHPNRVFPLETAVNSSEQVVDSLFRVAGAWDRDCQALRHWVEEVIADKTSSAAQGIHPELLRSGLQYRIARVLAEGHPLIYASPSWIKNQSISTSFEQLYYVTTLLFMAYPGDFLLLHLITSLHALEQISLCVSEEEQQNIIQLFWMGMLAILFSRGHFPSRSQLERLHELYQGAADHGADQAIRTDWDQVVARAIEEEEEHNPKMVYVMRRLWKRYGFRSIYRSAASYFTTTPLLPSSFDELPVGEMSAS